MLAASSPTPRPDARMLVVDGHGGLRHARPADLVHHLRSGDVLVANDAATIPASLGGVHEPTGEAIEVRLAGRPTLAADAVAIFTAVVFGEGDARTQTEDRPPPPPLREGDDLILGPLHAVVERRLGHPRLVELRFACIADDFWAGLARHGRPIQYSHVREPLSLRDMWTAVAALPAAFEPPSATFLLDWRLLSELRARRIGFATVTLAAGISSTGDEDLDARFPLDEPYRVPLSTARAVAAARGRGGRVVAVGTTTTRALEHAACSRGVPRAGGGVAIGRIGPATSLRAVDAIVTGVHEPGDSHYELLRAFAPDPVLRRATEALEAHRYRTHEFGDSMLVERHTRTSRSAPSSPCELRVSFPDRAPRSANRCPEPRPEAAARGVRSGPV